MTEHVDHAKLVEDHKADDGKPTFDLLPEDALAEINRVLIFGAAKYTDGHEVDALLERSDGPSLGMGARSDARSRSGINHLAHAACSLLFFARLQQQTRWQ